MPDKDKEIIQIVAGALTKLDDEQKEKFKNVCEGVALFAEKQEQGKTA